MYQNHEAFSVIRVGIEPHSVPGRTRDVGPLHVSRNETGKPKAQLYIIPAPGGAAFVEDKPSSERR